MAIMKKILVFTIAGIVISTLIGAPAFASEAPEWTPEPPLFFRAINAGYKDENSAQNYDFFKLAKTIDGDLDLSAYKIQYFNGSDNLAGEIEFAEQTYLRGDTVIFGFSKAPQFADASPRYLYDFGSAGLASTAGRLKILRGEEVIDEVCWGKLTCENQFTKFATGAEENKTAIRLPDMTFIYEKYYPEIDGGALFVPEPEPESEPEPELPPEPAEVKSCAGLKITEIYSYYETSADEQFVEIYNSLDQDLELNGCTLRYKTKNYPLEGTLSSGQYMIIQNIPLTKDPSSELTLEIIDDGGPIETVSYAHGQKAGTSLALLEGQWLRTHAPTPAAANVYQEFRTCPEGKVINPATGNCINVVAETEPVACKDGYYRNPETGRCKKYEEPEEQKTCEEGYELNPETNRCRKIRASNLSDYPVEEIKEESHSSPQIFVAIWALVALGVIIVIYVIVQFRHEIAKIFRRAKL